MGVFSVFSVFKRFCSPSIVFSVFIKKSIHKMFDNFYLYTSIIYLFLPLSKACSTNRTEHAEHT